MSIKNKLTKSARNMLPEGAIKRLEANYRSGRSKILSTFYGQPARKLRVIAVTGTNGKTTTVNYLNEILKEAGYITAMFTTANIEIAGVQNINTLNATVGTTARMQRFFRDAKHKKAEFVLLEATSHALDQYKIAGIPIEMAIMTNLTQDHLDYHHTIENYAEAKAKLFEMKPKFMVLNSDDEWFDYFNKYSAQDQKITYGSNSTAEVRIDQVKLYKKGSEAHLTIDNNVELEIATNLPGKFNVYNMVAATAGAYLLGVSLESIQEGIANLEGIPGRFERVTEATDYDVIVDYAHTPDALEKLLETAKSIAKNRTILVFGACGDRDKIKRPVMGEIASRLADRVIVTDEEPYSEDPNIIRAAIIEGTKKNDKIPAHVEEIADRRQAIKKALKTAKKDDIILITGMGHEQFMIVNGERVPWNDAEVVRELLKENHK